MSTIKPAIRQAPQAGRHPSRSATCKVPATAVFMASLAACGGSKSAPQSAPPTLAGKAPSGFVELREVQVAYIGNAGGGSGTLTYQGRRYPFFIAGIGVGGIGASTIEAEGEVYNLTDIAQFPGAYGLGQYGAVAVTASIGDMWLENPNKVVMHLKAKREGLMLSVGAEAIDVRFNQ